MLNCHTIHTYPFTCIMIIPHNNLHFLFISLNILHTKHIHIITYIFSYYIHDLCNHFIHSCIPSQHTTHIPLPIHIYIVISYQSHVSSFIFSHIEQLQHIHNNRPYAYTSHTYITPTCFSHIHSTYSSHINIYVHHFTHIAHASMYVSQA